MVEKLTLAYGPLTPGSASKPHMQFLEPIAWHFLRDSIRRGTLLRIPVVRYLVFDMHSHVNANCKISIDSPGEVGCQSLARALGRLRSLVSLIFR
jgi:hypothetical protein